uniref:Ankyrin repeat and kinase domain containing 1 n=1 Tax=Cyanistes caeruleus TaxID=156563 RepID=A0A8C0UA58_CYACU
MARGTFHYPKLLQPGLGHFQGWGSLWEFHPRKAKEEAPGPAPRGEAGSPEELGPEELGRLQENGLTLLHLMVLQGNVAKVRLLLGRRAGVNSAAGGGCTPLLVAVQRRLPEICCVLIEHGADVNARGKFRVVQYLLKNGISVNSLDQNHYSALHLAVARGKYLICEKLIKYGANVELRTDKGWTPLHLAAFKGHVEIIRLLKGSRARLDAKGSMDWTPLHLATRYGDEPAVSELLRCGADPNTAERSHWPWNSPGKPGPGPGLSLFVGRGRKFQSVPKT